MSLNANTLKNAIIAAIDTKLALVYPQSVTGLAPYHAILAAAVAEEVVSHLTAYGVILPNGSPVMAAGATNVTGKGTIT